MIVDRIIDYRDLIDTTTDAFVGRQWVRDAIDAFLEASGPRSFLVLGEPGSGKTSFLADLVRRRSYPHHFIGKGSRLGLTTSAQWRNPVRFAESVGYQLLRDYGGWIMRWEDWGISVRQEIKELDGLLIGADLGNLQATPRPVDGPLLEVQQEVDRFGPAAQAIAVYVDEWWLDVEQLVQQLVVTPLRAIATRWPDRPIVLVVDALDEADDYSNRRHSILELLPTGDVPPNVRLLLSSRSGDHLSRDFLAQCRTFWLSQDERGLRDPRTMEDARGYASNLALEPAVARVLLERHVEPGLFADRVAHASQGNFLYLHHYAQGVRQGELDLLSTDTLPRGLNGIYEDFLRKIRHQSQDVPWDQGYKSVLGVLAVGQEPVTRRQIRDFSAVAEATVATILVRISQFLEQLKDGQSETRYALYHSSLGEYLISPRNEDYIDKGDQHRRIVQFYRDRAGPWGPDGGENWTHLDSYGRRHLPAHLSVAGQMELLTDLLLDYRWLQAKLDATDIGAVLADFALSAVDPDRVDPGVRSASPVARRRRSTPRRPASGAGLERTSPRPARCAVVGVGRGPDHHLHGKLYAKRLELPPDDR